MTAAARRWWVDRDATGRDTGAVGPLEAGGAQLATTVCAFILRGVTLARSVVLPWVG